MVFSLLVPVVDGDRLLLGLVIVFAFALAPGEAASATAHPLLLFEQVVVEPTTAPAGGANRVGALLAFLLLMPLLLLFLVRHITASAATRPLPVYPAGNPAAAPTYIASLFANLGQRGLSPTRWLRSRYGYGKY